MDLENSSAEFKNKSNDIVSRLPRFSRNKRVRAQRTYCEISSDDEEVYIEEKRPVKFRVPRSRDRRLNSGNDKKQTQTSATLKWLAANYELKEGMCLPRCVLYTHYLDFCKKGRYFPSGPATFGKVIRQQFPKLTTRRLGTRGQSKYHYYGISVRETSPYYHTGYCGKGLTRFSSTKQKPETSSKRYSLSSKSGTLLPEFPSAKKLDLPDGIPLDKVETFIMMYRTHCQRMLDTVISANFDEVREFIRHFWQGMPLHMQSVLKCQVLANIIAVCDFIVYKVLIDVLIPSSIQDLPESLRTEIMAFADNLLDWLKESLGQFPKPVREAKFEVARVFAQGLQRQVSFVHLAQTARSMLLSYEAISSMTADLRKIDLDTIITKCSFVTNKHSQGLVMASKFLQEFKNLLNKQAPLEAFTEWLDSMVDRCVLQEHSKDKHYLLKEKAKHFLLVWTFFTSKILEDLTLKSAPSFGSFHLIHMTLEEYVLLVIENQLALEMETKLKASLEMHTVIKEFPVKSGSNSDIPHGTAIQPKKLQQTAERDKNCGSVLIRNTPCERKRTKQPILPKDNSTAKHIILKTAASAQSCCPVAIVTPQANAVSNVTTSDVKLISSASSSEGTQSRSVVFPPHVSNEVFHEHEGYQNKYNTYRELVPASLERGFIAPNVTLNSSDFVGASWLAADANSLSILNTISLTDSNAPGMLTREGIYSVSRATNDSMMPPYPAGVYPRPDLGPAQGKQDLNGNSYFTSESMSTQRAVSYSYYDHAQDVVLPEVGPYQNTGVVNTLTPLRINSAGSREVGV